MSMPKFDADDDLFTLGRSYLQNIKVTLICLLLGGGFLATARFLPKAGALEARFLLIHIVEFLGWAFLVLSVTILFLGWRERKELESWLSSYEGLESSWGPPTSFGHLGSASGTKHRALRTLRISAKALANTESAHRSEAIDKLYAELRPLMSRATADPSIQGAIQAKLADLRRLQSEEAEEMEKRFEAGLLLKPGEGWQALKRADELLARYENPSSPDAPTERKN